MVAKQMQTERILSHARDTRLRVGYIALGNAEMPDGKAEGFSVWLGQDKIGSVLKSGSGDWCYVLPKDSTASKYSRLKESAYLYLTRREASEALLDSQALYMRHT